MIDYGGREAVADAEITRCEVVSRGEYKNISFIHEVVDRTVDDVTVILAEAALPEITAGGADLQDSRHARDLRKHETA